MPRKKTAEQAETEPSAQPVKKFKADTGAAATDEPVARRSLRSRPLDENRVDCNTSPVTRATRGPAKPLAEEVSPSRPRRASQLVDQKPPAVVKSSPSNRSCPLEVSVQVTPCDLSERMDRASVTEPSVTETSVTETSFMEPSVTETSVTEPSGGRKRKSKISPRAEEKRSKLTPNKTNSCSSLSSQQSDTGLSAISPGHYIRECSVKLDMNSHGEIGAARDLPTELPAKSADPLFTRPQVRRADSHQNKPQQPDTSFSVMSYNILAECHRLRNDYSYTSEEYLNMGTTRGHRIVEEIKHMNADVVCLQEVDQEYFNEALVKTMHMLGYEGLFYKRRGDYYTEGASTFYKTSQFTLKEHHEFSYMQLANQDIDRLEHIDEIKDSLRQHVNREAVLLVCRFTHNASGREVVIGNTHLTWTRFIDIDIPCMQTSYAFKAMDRISNHGEIPFLLCGDFNMRRSDPGYQLATDGYLNDQSIKTLQQLNNVVLPDGEHRSLVNLLWCAFQHPCREIGSAYNTMQGKEPVITSINNVMHHAVDYMWTSQVETTSVTQVNDLHHPMPNIIYPSDHVSLSASYSFQ